MSEIQLKVEQTKLAILTPLTLVGTSLNYDTCKFVFDTEWNGYIKTAVFRSNVNIEPIAMLLADDGTCTIPWEPMQNAGLLYIGVFGIKDTIEIPTNFVMLRIVEGTAGNNAPPPPTLDIYAQIIKKVDSIRTEGDTFINAEVIAARGTYPNLNDRLDNSDIQLAEIMNKVSDDFFNVIGYRKEWVGISLASGIGGTNTSVNKHYGIVKCVSSASANSGYSYLTNNNVILLAGGGKTTIIFLTATTLAGVTMRMGFHNAIDHNAPVDGVYCKIGGVGGNEFTGQTAKNSVASTTATSYTVAAATWYRLTIVLNSDSTLATFKLYADDSDTVLWTDTLATNIPTASAVGHGYICTIASPSGATNIGSIDYMDMIFPNARRVV